MSRLISDTMFLKAESEPLDGDGCCATGTTGTAGTTGTTGTTGIVGCTRCGPGGVMPVCEGTIPVMICSPAKFLCMPVIVCWG